MFHCYATLNDPKREDGGGSLLLAVLVADTGSLLGISLSFFLIIQLAAVVVDTASLLGISLAVFWFIIVIGKLAFKIVAKLTDFLCFGCCFFLCSSILFLHVTCVWNVCHIVIFFWIIFWVLCTNPQTQKSFNSGGKIWCLSKNTKVMGVECLRY